MIDDLLSEIEKLRNPAKAVFLQRFFKTGKGEYAEGDIFYGFTVPQSRVLASKYEDLPMKDVLALLKSKIHEARLIALIILTHKFKKGDEKLRKEIYEFYLSNTKYINNWDLVDLSADKIVGGYLLDRDKSFLKKLANSDSIWERRISIIATFQFMKDKKETEWAYKISKILLYDRQDLIQKAVGWMLRESGKRVSEVGEEKFLKPVYKTMPRTMLRYAIERFSEEKRLKYLKGEI